MPFEIGNDLHQFCIQRNDKRENVLRVNGENNGLGLIVDIPSYKISHLVDIVEKNRKARTSVIKELIGNLVAMEVVGKPKKVTPKERP